MNYVSIPGLSQRHARMPLKAEQHCHIAGAYDKAAFDISLPAHTRVAFARKADWFRLLARVGKRERATTNRCCKKTSGSTTGSVLVLGLLDREDGASWVRAKTIRFTGDQQARLTIQGGLLRFCY